ncbi:16S rRNA (uracil1498-N3)-methyltransferase [Microbacteriaceae bacterium MWH-Ta3]|nr:16S rRNA (uracil1498-N3)-methyltransferase [Microbacteriaceae bacterium MWH-Ta3]
MAHLYIAESLTESDTAVHLTGPEARHAAQVGRLRVGETIQVTNGRGVIAAGTARSVEKDSVHIDITERRVMPAPRPSITLVQALAKGDRDELAVQMATELGIDRVIPWAAARSVSRWEGPKIPKGVERWVSIVREASKQAIRSWIPSVEQPVTSAQLARECDGNRVLILEPTATTALADLDWDDRNIVLVVGPEGGITPAEIEALTAAGAQTVRLGDTVVRTSTAGAAALSVMSARLGRWS